MEIGSGFGVVATAGLLESRTRVIRKPASLDEAATAVLFHCDTDRKLDSDPRDVRLSPEFATIFCAADERTVVASPKAAKLDINKTASADPNESNLRKMVPPKVQSDVRKQIVGLYITNSSLGDQKTLPHNEVWPTLEMRVQSEGQSENPLQEVGQ